MTLLVLNPVIGTETYEPMLSYEEFCALLVLNPVIGTETLKSSLAKFKSSHSPSTKSRHRD